MREFKKICKNMRAFALLLLSLFFGVTAVYAACSDPAGNAGELEFFSAIDRYKFCDGTNWQAVTANESATACANDRAIDYNPLTDNKLAFCRNAKWNTMDCTVTGTACATAGEIDYNTTTDMFQYCNGSFWVDMSSKIAGGGGSDGPYWVVTVGLNDHDQGYAISEASDGGFVFLGEAGSSSNKYGQLIKLTSAGALDWSYKFDFDTGANGFDRPQDMIVTSTGDIIVVGNTNSTGITAPYNGFIMKFNNSGVEQWTRTFGGANTAPNNDQDEALTVVEDTDGGYIIGGLTQELNQVNDPLYLKYNSAGVIATGSYSVHANATGEREKYTKLIPLRAGGFLGAGQYKGGEEALLVKLNAAGAVTLAKSYKANGANTRPFYGAIEAENGDVIAVGYSNVNVCGGGGDDAYIIRMQNDLTTKVWTKCLGGNGDDKLYNVVEVPCTGDIIAVGMTESSFANGGNDGWIVKLNSSGVEQWTKTIDHSGGAAGDDDDDEALHDVIISNDGGIVAVGHVDNDAGGDANDRLIVVKLDLNGTLGGTACTRISADKALTESGTTDTVGTETGSFGDFGADNHNDQLETVTPTDTSGTIGITTVCSAP